MRRGNAIVLGLCAVVVVSLVVANTEPPKPDTQLEEAAGLIATPGTMDEYYPEAEATDPPGPSPKSVYCVREGGFPSDTYTEGDYPECIWVDRLEDVPAGEPCMPSGCNSSDHEYTRRYWCTEGMAEVPPINQVRPECRKYFR